MSGNDNFQLAEFMTVAPEKKNAYLETLCNCTGVLLCLHASQAPAIKLPESQLTVLVETITISLLVFCFRYELLRRKIQQPLASNPPEDLNLWHNIYSGTWRFYEDKGLSR